MTKHIPIMTTEILEGLNIQPGFIILDGTVGLGGHARLMLEASQPGGVLFAFDRDKRNLDEAEQNLSDIEAEKHFINASYAEIAEHVQPEIDAGLIDLGFSSVHVDEADRGFSFQNDGPLDMRYDTRQELTAEHIVNSWSKEDLAEIFRKYGEEPHAAKIASKICEERKKERIVTTGRLAEIAGAHLPRRGKRHPATNIFQAIRIAVNDELAHVEKGLEEITVKLKSGGKLAVLTFHSLEDRLVKHWAKDQDGVHLDPKKPQIPSREEQQENPRSRSAKLRIIVKN